MDTVGARIFAVRSVMPRGDRLAVMSREAFAALVAKRLGVGVSTGALADWEKGRTEPSLAVLTAVAALDPLQRGRAWLAFGEEPRAAAAAPPSAEGYVAQGRVIPREMYVRAQTQPEDVEAAPPAKRKANGGGKRRG